jgi:hypothetical protein
MRKVVVRWNVGCVCKTGVRHTHPEYYTRYARPPVPFTHDQRERAAAPGALGALAALPAELMQRVLDALPLRDRMAAAQTCLAMAHMIWHTLYPSVRGRAYWQLMRGAEHHEALNGSLENMFGRQVESPMVMPRVMLLLLRRRPFNLLERSPGTCYAGHYFHIVATSLATTALVIDSNNTHVLAFLDLERADRWFYIGFMHGVIEVMTNGVAYYIQLERRSVRHRTMIKPIAPSF